MRTKYRPDVDGLRAVAVVSVVLFHAFPGTFPGGYVGVDVFFVISGFLIASVLFDQGITTSFSIKNFYVRRIRRIFPALFLVLSSTLVAGWFLLVPSDLDNLGKHMVGGAGFVSNLVLWSESGYFDTAAELKPLLHLWSLGIEEQFYIVFPLFIAVVRRFRRSRTMSIAICLAGSLAYSITLTPQNQSAAFYNPLTRIWEILLGVLLADVMTKASFGQPNRRIHHASSIFGALLLIGAIVTFDSATLFPGWRALFPTVGTVLLIYAGSEAVVNRYVLNWRLMVGVGLISYPLYLWHWPILVLSRIKNGVDTSTLHRTVLVVLSFGLAYVTYRTVERPFRYRLRAKPAVVALVSLMAVMGASGQLVRAFEGFPGRYQIQLRELVEFKPNFLDDALFGLCWLDQFDKEDSFSESCLSSKSRGEHWLVWGDSHAARLTPGLRSVLGPTSTVSQLTRSSCPPILDIEFVECRRSNEHIMSRIEQTPPDRVVMFGRWETYFQNNELSVLTSRLSFTVGRLKSYGVDEIVLVGPAPFWEGNLPTNLVDLLTQSGKSTLPQFTDFRLTRIAHDAEKQLKKISSSVTDLKYISLLEAMCNESGCMTSTNGKTSGLTTWDYGHLTTPGARFVASVIIEIIG